MQLCGMLEHIRTVNGLPRLANFGMYRPHAMGLDANDAVPLNELARACLLDWLKALGQTGGASFLVVFKGGWAGHVAWVVVFTSSDAAMDGTRTPGPRHHQFVIMPHLLSIGMAFDAVQRELRRLESLGKIELCGEPPFWPLRCTCQGTTPRKYEAGRDRRTSDGSAPHTDLFDSASEPVCSLNGESIKPRWVNGVPHPVPKELKPSLQKLMRDLSILIYLGFLSGECVYLFADDFKDYFNQFDLAPEELWKSVVHTRAAQGDPSYDPIRPSTVFAVEPFGLRLLAMRVLLMSSRSLRCSARHRV
jgi:hypothetical protein